MKKSALFVPVLVCFGLLAGCTIAVDRYRDAVAAACEEARPIDEGGSLTRAVRGMVDGLRGR